MTGAASTRQACVYLLGSLINHCCTPGPAPSGSACASSLKRDKNKNEPGPNCSWRIGPSGLAHFVKPRHICVQARRDIREGEQLTWDYGKREKGFVCECDTCRDSGLGSICNVL
jgi:SET domain-containing protein